MIGLALCRHIDNKTDFLFQMPRYSALEKGDRVIVETKHGEKEAIVDAATTIPRASDEYGMIIKATGASEPLKKVLRKVIYRDLCYDDEDLAVWNNLDAEVQDSEAERKDEANVEM